MKVELLQKKNRLYTAMYDCTYTLQCIKSFEESAQVWDVAVLFLVSQKMVSNERDGEGISRGF